MVTSLYLECAIEELPLLAENLEVDMIAANQQYRERLLRQKVKGQQASDQGHERERIDDNAAISRSSGQAQRKMKM